jgi:hypothetical protein
LVSQREESEKSPSGERAGAQVFAERKAMKKEES